MGENDIPPLLKSNIIYAFYIFLCDTNHSFIFYVTTVKKFLANLLIFFFFFFESWKGICCGSRCIIKLIGRNKYKFPTFGFEILIGPLEDRCGALFDENSIQGGPQNNEKIMISSAIWIAYFLIQTTSTFQVMEWMIQS